MKEPSGRARWISSALLLAVVAVALAARIPYLANSTALFNSDEAVNALFLKHLLRGDELGLYPWDTAYYGIVESLIALPYTWFLGAQPLAFKLGAVTGLVFLILATYLLGRRLMGRAEGLVAASLLALFSPKLVEWSVFATGGLVLVVAWGTLTFLYLDRLRGAPSGRGFLVCGLIAGFGLYIYELYLVYIAVLAVGAVASSFAWRAVLAASPAGRRDALRMAPRQLGYAALFLVGLTIGWLPKVVAVASGRLGEKIPYYHFADLGKIAENVELLVTRCIPVLLGTNPAGAPELEKWVGPAGPLTQLLGGLLLAAWAAAWTWGVVRNRHNLEAMLRRAPDSPSTETLLVLLIPVTALLFVISPNPQDVHSDHYLLPWLTALPLFAAALLVQVARRRPMAAVLLAVIWIGFPAYQIATWYQSRGLVDRHLRVVHRQEEIFQVIDYLREKKIRGGYSWYWLAYKATFLSDEDVVIAPLDDWDRYPAYSRRVDSLPSEAYVFESVGAGWFPRSHFEFERRIRSAETPVEVRRFGRYLVYTHAHGRRLFVAPRPLDRPLARIELLGAPGQVLQGTVMEVPVRLTNLGSEPWSAFGGVIGVNRVDLSYRWHTSEGAPVVLHDGKRTFLRADLYPGQTVDISAQVEAPGNPGTYRLTVSPVQEGAQWFADVGGGAATMVVHVEDTP